MSNRKFIVWEHTERFTHILSNHRSILRYVLVGRIFKEKEKYHFISLVSNIEHRENCGMEDIRMLTQKVDFVVPADTRDFSRFVTRSGIREWREEKPQVDPFFEERLFVLQVDERISDEDFVELSFKLVEFLRERGIQVSVDTNDLRTRAFFNLVSPVENPDIYLYVDRHNQFKTPSARVMLKHTQADTNSAFCQAILNGPPDNGHSNKSVYYLEELSASHEFYRFSKRILKSYVLNLLDSKTRVRQLYKKIRNLRSNISLHEFPELREKYIYLSASGRIMSLSEESFQVLTAALAEPRANILPECEPTTVMFLSRLLYWEAESQRQITAQLDSGIYKVHNLPDAILSFLGSRKCNLQCSYCFSEHHSLDQDELTKEKIFRGLDMVYRKNRTTQLRVDSNLGGEPALDMDLSKRVYQSVKEYQAAYNKNITFGFLSNGTVLSDADIAWLKGHIPNFGFSLDGNRQTNDQVRKYGNGKGSFEDTKAAIHKIRSDPEWPAPIGVSSVLTRKNMNIKQRILDLHELGFRYMTIKPVRAAEHADYALRVSDMEHLKYEYNTLFGFLIEQGEKYGSIHFLKSILLPLDYLGRFLFRTFHKNLYIKRCGANEHIYSVNNKGEVFPCDSFNGCNSCKTGSLYEDEVVTDFQIPLVDHIVDLKRCKDCWARYLCGGICTYVSHINGYRQNSVTDFECEFSRYLISKSFLFWEEANKKFSAELKDQIQEYMRESNFFMTANNRTDNFVYAPC